MKKKFGSKIVIAALLVAGLSASSTSFAADMPGTDSDQTVWNWVIETLKDFFGDNPKDHARIDLDDEEGDTSG